MAAIRINLFGRLAVFVDDRPLPIGPPHTKPIELLAYLLVHRQHSHLREAVATLLWPELPAPHTRKHLRKALCMLQHLLADAVGPDDPSLLLIEHDWIALNPARELWLDVDAFEQAYALTQRHAVGVLDSPIAQVIERAVALYEGELLAGLYAAWCLHERERLENMYLDLHRLLLVHAESQQAYQLAIEHGLEILRHDRANEHAHCDLMRLHYLNGNRSAALRQYDHCVAALASELGVKPCACTEQLYRQLCQDELPLPSPESNGEHVELQRELGAAADSRRQLQQVRAELQQMLELVQDEIDHVERLLQG
jgi:DNA-binding SARP family transcriptional activator